jgi:ring-1,2-phenylacetyl-CoA epoxidase subunit PaaE
VRVVRAPRFHWLRVADVRRETPDAISLTFDIPTVLQPFYAFHAGQYLTLRTTLDGIEARRSYSICSGEDDGELRIAIKRQEGGVFSVWAHDRLKPGLTIEVMSPTGRFGIASYPPGPRLHVAIAAGSGITPVLSVMKTVLSREPESRFLLFYGSRATAEIMFRDTLEDLKDRYLSRLAISHILSRERQDIDILNGHLDREKLNALLPRILGGVAIDHAYVCGPFGMIEAAQSALAGIGLSSSQLHIERFNSALSGRPQPPRPLRPDAKPQAIASVIVNGARTEVPVTEGQVVLDAALRAGLDLPFSCKGGMCTTCRAKLLEGRVEMELNYSLEPWELAAGFVLTCQSRPTTPRVVIDYDQQ